ncbi:hypothetical protein EG328_004365 [Venturia inaequalis]|uniref:Uncharacterized protein n=1 Tax=Venturia inaequalis TaxID=5025 RepID=A0A8H3YTU0_VENIN|nr:hypothetical protein EG328_004365 [Venturia inaequalis]
MPGPPDKFVPGIEKIFDFFGPLENRYFQSRLVTPSGNRFSPFLYAWKATVFDFQNLQTD